MKTFKLNGEYDLQEIMKIVRDNASEYFTDGVSLTSAELVKKYLTSAISQEDREHFGVFFLNAKNELIKFEILFKGTIDESAVYPRVVLKRALELNASSVILSHNHPSGNSTPSKADEHITAILKEALRVVDIDLLDHFITGKDGVTSMAEKGLI